MNNNTCNEYTMTQCIPTVKHKLIQFDSKVTKKRRKKYIVKKIKIEIKCLILLFNININKNII